MFYLHHGKVLLDLSLLSTSITMIRFPNPPPPPISLLDPIAPKKYSFPKVLSLISSLMNLDTDQLRRDWLLHYPKNSIIFQGETSLIMTERGKEYNFWTIIWIRTTLTKSIPTNLSFSLKNKKKCLAKHLSWYPSKKEKKSLKKLMNILKGTDSSKLLQ